MPGQVTVVFFATFLWTVAGAGAAVGQEEAPSAHDPQHEHASAVMRLNQGRPWETDAPLRTGMERIHTAVAQTQPPLSREAAATLTRAVEEQVSFLVAHCKLEPAADATLHTLIAQLLTAAAKLREDPASIESLRQMRETLHEYPRYFNHPNWTPLETLP